MWLLKPDVLQAMRAGRSLGYEPTLEERATFERAMREAYASKSAEQPRNMQIAGSTAQITIEGVLTEKPDCFALIFGSGNTTYASIRKALALAEADPNVKDIVLNINSPGGHVNGLFETFAALDAVTKTIRVRSSFAASAAYGLAAVAGPIEAVTPAAEFGSIGVAASYFVDDQIVDIASTDAPKKRPDVKTDEGVAMVREELDALHEEFVAAIARGRSATTGEDVTAKTVNSEFGQGGMFTAATAKKRGMIDRTVSQSKRARAARSADASEQVTLSEATAEQLTAALSKLTPEPAPQPPVEQESSTEPPAPAAADDVPNENASAGTGGAQPKGKTMTKEELKAQHPELYAAVLDEGTQAERKRVTGHIKLGEAAGDIKMAHDAINKGVSTADMHDDYMAANMRRGAVENRQVETDAAGAAVNNAKDTEVKGARDAVADEVERMMGGAPSDE